MTPKTIRKTAAAKIPKKKNWRLSVQEMAMF